MADTILVPSGIYAIVNRVNGKRYVGSAKRLRYRFAEHVRLLEKGVHHSPTLQRSWKKYGRGAFEYVILERVMDLAQLLKREQHWIDVFGCIGKSGYNVSPTAGSPLGVKHTEQSRQNMSRAAMGKKHSEEHKAKIAQASKGRKISEEAMARRVATRRANDGYAQSPESLAKMVATRRARGGFGHSEETRALISKKTKAGIAQRTTR